MITPVITLFSVITLSSWRDEPVIGVITPVITLFSVITISSWRDRSGHTCDHSLWRDHNLKL